MQNDAGEPVQVIHPETSFALSRVDLSSVDREEQSQRLAELARVEAETAFDFEQGPLIRGQLIDIGVNNEKEPEYVLLVTMHHIVSDGWSMGIFSREISALYEAYSSGKENPLAPLEIQYADYAHWQRSTLAEEGLGEQLSYWQGQLSDAPELLTLPWDSARPAQQSYRGGHVGIYLGVDLTEQMTTLAQSKGMTLYMVLLSAWGMLLSRLSGQSTVVVGTPVANRPREELESIIGYFVNTLAIRLDVDTQVRLSDYLDEVKGRMLSAFDNQDVPFEQVVEAIQPTRSLNHNALYQTDFTFDHVGEEAGVELSGVSLGGVGGDIAGEVSQAEAMVQSDVSLTLRESLVPEGRVVEGSIGYISALFDEPTIARWGEYYARLLEEMVRAPEAYISDVEMLSEIDQRHLLETLNASEPQELVHSHIHEVFERQVEKTPEVSALVLANETLSYGELNERSNRLAHYLLGEGIEVGDLIGVYQERSLELFVSLLGILKAGGAYVMLDPAQPRQRITRICEASELRIVLSTEVLKAQLSGMEQRQVICIDSADVRQSLSARAQRNPGLSLSKDAGAFVYFTSGTSGVPKGALNSHEGAVNAMLAMATELELGESDRVLQFAALGFDVVIEEVLPAWFSGACVVLRDEEGLLGTEELQEMLTRNRITVCELMPIYWSQWVDYLELQGLRPPGSLRCVMSGGDRLSMSTYAKWKGFNIPIINVYGLTEAGCTSIVYKAVGEQPYEDFLPIGRPLSNTQVYVLDAQQKLLPAGVNGELYIGGVSVGLGYVREAEQTKAAFIDNPYAEGRLYRTGDSVRWLSDGNLEFLGRVDDQLKIRGYRIEPGEIESRLTEQTQIREALVVGYGEGVDKRLVGYVIAEKEGEDSQERLEFDEVRDELRKSVPEYMIPGEMMLLEAFPLSANGKLDRRALPEPDGSGLSRREYEAPQGDLEEALATIWHELLPVEQVSRWDNFFDLGGHSLLVIQLMSKLSQHGWEMAVQWVFETPVLSELAQTIGTSANRRYEAPANLISVDCDQITPEMLPLFGLQEGSNQLSQSDIDEIVSQVPGGVENVQDIYPLAPLQEGILFHHRLNEEGAYINPILLRLDNNARLEPLLTALQSVVDRHDILRTAILWQGLSQSVQVVCRQARLNIEKLDLLAGEEEQAQLDELMSISQLHIEVEQAPLMRIQVIHPVEDEHCYVLIQEHHLVTDHVSGEIILEEVLSYLTGEESSLSTPMPYRNFVAHTLSETSAEEGELYFTEQLGDIEEPTAPYGLLDVYGDGSEIEEQSEPLDAELSHQIRAVSKQWQVTPATLFHMAWGLVVSRCSGREEVVFGTMMSGRLQGAEGSDRTLGMFLNTLPLRLSAKGTLDVKEYLRQTHKRLVGLLPYEQVPLVAAQRCSSVPTGTPLFSALLNYRHSGKGVDTTGGLSVESIESGYEGIELLGGEERGNYPFDLSVDDLEDGFSLTAQIDRSVDAKRVLGYVIESITSLVESLRNEPERLLRVISTQPKSEERHLLEALNASDSLELNHSRIHEMFEHQVEKSPQAPALVLANETLSYKNLNERSNQVAHYLLNEGVDTGELVGVYQRRSIDTFVSILGIMKAGGAYVMLDPDQPDDRITRICEASELGVVLSTEALKAQLKVKEQTRVISIDSADVQQSLSASAQTNPHVSLSSDAGAFVYFTSGTSGIPKGALNSHEGAVNAMLSMSKKLQLTDKDRVLQFAALGFDVVIEEVLPAWFSGACVVLRDEEGLLGAAQLQQMLSRNRITVCELMSSYWSQWVDYLQMQGERPPASLRCVMLGSDRVSMNAYRKWQGYQIPIMNVFGLTETGCTSLVYRAEGEQPYEDYLPNGRPLSNTEIYVLDARQKLLPQGVIGELCIGGLSVGLGYVGDAEQTQASFIENPYAEGRLYRTGDRARWLSDGNLEFLGRADEQLKIRGYRVEPGEIESRLTEQVQISEALVVGYGEGANQRLVGYVIAGKAELSDSEERMDFDEVRKELKKSLPDYMIPSEMMVLDAFPLTATGKIDKSALPKPDGSGLSRQEYEAPEGEIEEAIATIWVELLQVERVGRWDNFFDLGGHSLLAVQLVARIEQSVSRTLSLKTLFDRPVLSDLACELEDSVDHEYIAIERVDRDQPLPLSWSQQRLWFIAQLDEQASLAYHIPVSVRLTGELNQVALDQTLSTLLERHEVLRTTVVQNGTGEPIQVIHPDKLCTKSSGLEWC